LLHPWSKWRATGGTMHYLASRHRWHSCATGSRSVYQKWPSPVQATDGRSGPLRDTMPPTRRSSAPPPPRWWSNAPISLERAGAGRFVSELAHRARRPLTIAIARVDSRPRDPSRSWDCMADSGHSQSVTLWFSWLGQELTILIIVTIKVIVSA